MVSIEQLEALPLFHRAAISSDYLDEMGHMNVRWYIALFDQAAWNFFASIGLNQTYFEVERGGIFALQQFIRYLAEVRAGETIAIRTRLLGRSAKRAHFMQFMINESSGVLASTIEVLSSHVNLAVRRTSPFAPPLAEALDAYLAEHQQLAWEAPTCGIMQA